MIQFNAFVGNNWCNKKYFERKSLLEIRFRSSPLQVTSPCKPARSSQDHPTIYPVFTVKFFFPFCNYSMEKRRSIYLQFKKSKQALLTKVFSNLWDPLLKHCFKNNGTKHITRLHLGLSDLRDHKFKHGFLDSLNPICSCGWDIETTYHYLLHYKWKINSPEHCFNNKQRFFNFLWHYYCQTSPSWWQIESDTD